MILWITNRKSYRYGRSIGIGSVAYIGPKSRTERPKKTKIGTEVAHVTRDSDTSRQAALLTAALTTYQAVAAASVHGNVLSVGIYCYVLRGRVTELRVRRAGDSSSTTCKRHDYFFTFFTLTF